MGCNTSQEQRIANETINENINVVDDSNTESGFHDEDENTEKHENATRDEIITKSTGISEDFDEEAELAATKIQAAFRGHKVRTSIKVPATNVNDVSLNPKFETSKTFIETQTKKEKEGNNQQKNEEDSLDLNLNYKELADAAIKIQATFRGHMQRKLVNNTSSSNELNPPKEIDVDEIRREIAEELDIDLNDPELNKAAARIQASFRGFKTRKDIVT